MRLIDADALPIKFDGHTFSVWKNDLDAAPTVNPYEWISVEDRLPDEDIRVLVYLDTDRSYTKLDTDRRFEGKWVRWSTDVTHWMPLPSPPTEKEN